MELEAKYRATRHIRARELEALPWTTFVLGERQTLELRDTILDTAQRQLAEHKHTLRVRHNGKGWVLTYKGPSKVRGAIHRREEIEESISPEVVEQQDLWPVAIREPLERLIDDAALEPLFSIRNRRRVWAVLRDGILVAELALDRGTISAGDRVQALHEIEIESKGDGSDADIKAIATFLRQHLPLEPEQFSKAQRGLALLEHREHLADLKIVQDATPMTSDAVLAAAGRAVLAKHAIKLHDALLVALRGEDPEGVHQSRVAIRRLRATMAALAEAVYERAAVQPLRRGLKQLADTLSPVRDADVFLMGLAKEIARLSPDQQAQFVPLQAVLSNQRDTGRVALQERLAHRKTQKLLDRLDAFLLNPEAGIRALVEEQAERPRMLVRHWAGSLLWAHYEQVRAYEPDLATAPVATLHQLRIEIKHLRYTLELFLAALADEAESLHTQLVSAQDHLGELQDAEVAIELVDSVLPKHPENQALVNYRAKRVEERERLVANVGQAVGPIFALPFRRRLASLISKL